MSEIGEAVDSQCVIIHLDADAFYAQCEELHNPTLREVPLGIQQKHIVVTCNYPARRAGVTKLMTVVEAQRVCPSLVCVSGEDLTRYRNVSKQYHKVVAAFGPAERLGMDEVWVDVTSECHARLKMLRDIQNTSISNDTKLKSSPEWYGHIVRSGQMMISESRYRPMDIRAAPEEPAKDCSQFLLNSVAELSQQGMSRISADSITGSVDSNSVSSVEDEDELLLRIGSQIAQELREQVWNSQNLCILSTLWSVGCREICCA